MLNAIYTNQFKKDLKIAAKRRKDLNKLKKLMAKIVNEETLDTKYKKHRLIGNYKGRWECHIEPDWLIIYFENSDEVIFERTGSHSDLFD
jgi:mRNA interferase YafQ